MYTSGVELEFIRPGKPVENAYIESFNSRLRDECLNLHLFFSVEDAQIKLDHWKEDYNHVRPHGSLGNRTPSEMHLNQASFRSPSAPGLMPEKQQKILRLVEALN